MSHLGDKISALVDGQLSADAVERAQTHLAGCAGCRDLVEVERLVKRRLAALTTPQPDPEMFTRLSLLAGPEGPLPPREGRVPGTPPVPVVTLPPIPARPGGHGYPSLRGLRLRTRAWRSPAAGPGRTRPTGLRPPGQGASPGPGRAARRHAGPRVRMAAVAAVVGTLGLLGVGVVGTMWPDDPAERRPAVTPPVDQIVLEPSRSGR